MRLASWPLHVCHVMIIVLPGGNRGADCASDVIVWLVGWLVGLQYLIFIKIGRIIVLEENVVSVTRGG